MERDRLAIPVDEEPSRQPTAVDPTERPIGVHSAPRGTDPIPRSRPIIFDQESVRQILANSKTQTRRVVKPQPEFAGVRSYERGKWARVISAGGRDEHDFFVPNPVASMGDYLPNTKNGPWISPYGDDPHDLLWVRETWAVEDASKLKLPEYCGGGNPDWIYYRDPVHIGTGLTWRSPIHMPRWASRITLRVTGVRVERVQEISELDCEAELGAVPYSLGDSAYPQFRERWEAINAKRGFGWDVNPWVWVVSFEVIK